jgi:zinc D-Ala-D-Ala carboxypeptidase
MNLSKNFTLAELTKTSTGLSNALPKHLEENLQALVDNVLQPARDALGAIVVTSCYRSPEVNVKALGEAQSTSNIVWLKQPTSASKEAMMFFLIG